MIVVWILIRVESEGLLIRVIKYLKRNKVFHKLFSEVEYRVTVTAEDRLRRNRGNRGDTLYMNPPRAWETCASCTVIWDWDSEGRGPYSLSRERRGKGVNKAPRGKGWIDTGRGYKQRVAGDCASPNDLNYITCPHYCLHYKPIAFDGLYWLANRTIEEHRRRIDQLERSIEFWRSTTKAYEDVCRTGGFLRYEKGRFVLVGGDEPSEHIAEEGE